MKKRRRSLAYWTKRVQQELDVSFWCDSLWMLGHKFDDELATRVLDSVYHKHNLTRGQLVAIRKSLISATFTATPPTRLGSVRAFLNYQCETGPGLCIEVKALEEQYKKFCELGGFYVCEIVPALWNLTRCQYDVTGKLLVGISTWPSVHSASEVDRATQVLSDSYIDHLDLGSAMEMVDSRFPKNEIVPVMQACEKMGIKLELDGDLVLLVRD